MTQKLAWGILGAGNIARNFARALEKTQRGVKGAVGSRSAEKAAAFASEHGFARAYGSYEELVADQEIDAVYVATPHPIHHPCVLLAAAAKKHILCEKPMGVTAAECEEMIQAARENGVVLLEAFMYRVHPQTIRIQQIIAEGQLGEVRTVRSSFTYGLGDDYNVRLDMSLRGGGLYDVGCYCINFSRMAAGEEPEAVEAVWQLGRETGVDENLACAMRFPSGALALFDVGVRAFGSSFAEIVGSKGSLLIRKPWKPHAQRAVMELSVAGEGTQEIVTTNGGDAYALETDHLAEVVCDNAEPLIPAENAVGNAAVMERLWEAMHG